MKIYNQLYQDIQAGKYSTSQRLPTEKELCQMFHVSRITSKKALDLLAEENLIVRVKGKGSYITHNQKGQNRLQAGTHKLAVIGVVMSIFDTSYGWGLLAAIEENCRKNNVLCLFSLIGGDQHAESKAIDDFIKFGVDGVIIMPVHKTYYNAKVLQLVIDGFPIVVIDRDLRGIPTHFVGTDNIAAAENAMDFLLQSGHQKIGVYSPTHKNTSSVEDRIVGVKNSLQKHNIHMDASYFCTDQLSGGLIYTSPELFVEERTILIEHMKNHPKMTAALAVNYNTALLLESAATKMGRTVPDDLCIVCFDSPVTETPGTYKFTHIQQNEDEMGRKAFDLVCELIKGEHKETTTKIHIDAKLVLGNSTKGGGQI